MNHDSDALRYHDTVDYEVADPAKILAQREGLATTANLPFGFHEVPNTRGESAYVFDMGPFYGALVQEGVGTKSLITQAMYRETGKSHFRAIAQDTVATFISDLVSVGATPVVTNAYWSASSYQWLADRRLMEDFIHGWREACDQAGVVWGGGETQALSGIVKEGALELAGTAFGVIKDRKRLMSQDRLKAGDAIVLLESSGIHANGATLARQVAERLPDTYQTVMADGRSFGEALLAPTDLYARGIDAFFAADLNLHYLSNLTGHGWRKLMRATRELSYEIDTVPPVPEVFTFIAQHSDSSATDMYGTYNMGAGYAVYLPAPEAAHALTIAREHRSTAWIAGSVKAGPRRVVIHPLEIVFGSSELTLR